MSELNLNSTPRPRILLVDDERPILHTLELTLRRAQYETVAVDDPLLAIAELQRQEFCVIISDQRMLGLTGLELLAEARRIQPFATRILITAVLSLDIVVEAINKGEIYRFLLKPWLHEEFMTTVRNGVQRYDLIRQNAQLQAQTQSMNERLLELNRSLEQQVRLVAEQNSQLAEMNVALAQNLTRSMELCVHTMRIYYPALGEQVRRVSHLCQAMAQTLRLPTEERHILESSALLYDIGLVGVPRQVIKKWQENPGALNLGERALIGQHPILGQELASFSKDLDLVGRIIRAHHERFDGNGYPDQLAGEQIPWLARLLAVAVTFASTRLTASDSIEHVKTEAGSALDPEAVRVFLHSLPSSESQRAYRPIGLHDLKPGMVLADNIYSHNGLLLVPEGQALNPTAIERVLTHNRHRPIMQSLLVYC